MTWKEFFESVDCNKCIFENCCTIIRDVQQRIDERGEDFEDACRFEMEATCIKKEVRKSETNSEE